MAEGIQASRDDCDSVGAADVNEGWVSKTYGACCYRIHTYTERTCDLKELVHNRSGVMGLSWDSTRHRESQKRPLDRVGALGFEHEQQVALNVMRI